MMYYDSSLIKKQQEKTFIKYKNFNIGKLLHKLQSDVLIKQIKILEINFNLSRIFVMILCESTYDQKLNDQILKRIHRSGQKRIVTYNIFWINTIIEDLIKQKRKNKSNFEKKIFIKMQKKNEKSVIAEKNVETAVVKENVIVI